MRPQEESELIHAMAALIIVRICQGAALVAGLVGCVWRWEGLALGLVLAFLVGMAAPPPPD